MKHRQRRTVMYLNKTFFAVQSSSPIGGCGGKNAVLQLPSQVFVEHNEGHEHRVRDYAQPD